MYVPGCWRRAQTSRHLPPRWAPWCPEGPRRKHHHPNPTCEHICIVFTQTRTRARAHTHTHTCEQSKRQSGPRRWGRCLPAVQRADTSQYIDIFVRSWLTLGSHYFWELIAVQRAGRNAQSNVCEELTNISSPKQLPVITYYFWELMPVQRAGRSGWLATQAWCRWPSAKVY
jgi:hypothetical protein